MRGLKAAATIAAAAAWLGAAAVPARACTPKTGLEAIVDDSGSMELSDPSGLRARALELLIDTQGNQSRTLGAVEFGTDAAALFGPWPIGSGAAAFKLALATLRHDNGGTDYNAAFALAASHNPGATARIFLTDGDHLGADPYANGHAGGPPVYAIGLGVGFDGSPGDLLLARIARESGGLYRRVDDASGLQAAMFDVNSAISCQAPPRRFSDSFEKVGPTRAHSVRLPRRIGTAQFALTWDDPGDRFTIGGFRVLRRGKLVAGTARGRRLRVSRARGATFMAVRVKGLVGGQLRFGVRATQLAAPGTEAELTTQVTRRAKR